MDNMDGKTVLEMREAVRAGDAAAAAKQHAAGRATARERIASLFDAGSFMEVDTLRDGANCVAGFGTVHARPVYCFAQDHTLSGGAMTEAQAEKIVKVLDMARLNGGPVVAMLDSAGMKVTEGAASLPAYAKIFAKMTRMSGICPMITLVMGECRGAAALFTQVSDIAIQVKGSALALHASKVMNSQKGVTLSDEALFGPGTMAGQGAVALEAGSEEEAVSLAISLLDMLPGSNLEDAPLSDEDDLNRTLIACDQEDARSLISQMADGGLYTELSSAYGTRAHTVLARVGGRAAGLIVCDHKEENGRLDAATCAKIARFVRLCDCYSMPVITLVHTDGLEVPSVNAQSWLMRTAGQMLYAYAEATCPKLAVIMGNAIGPAYVAMGGKAIADVVYAWEDAMIAPVTAEVAAAAFDDAALAEGKNRAQLENAYRASMDAKHAAALGLVDDVIAPRDMRKTLIAAMEFLASKHDANPPRKHGNLPL